MKSLLALAVASAPREEALRLWRRYRWLVWALVGFGVAAGFGFETPQAQFEAIRRTDSLLARAIDSLAAEAGSTHLGIERRLTFVTALARGECLDRPQRELELMGLPCDSLLSRRRP